VEAWQGSANQAGLDQLRQLAKSTVHLD